MNYSLRKTSKKIKKIFKVFNVLKTLLLKSAEALRVAARWPASGSPSGMNLSLQNVRALMYEPVDVFPVKQQRNPDHHDAGQKQDHRIVKHL